MGYTKKLKYEDPLENFTDRAFEQIEADIIWRSSHCYIPGYYADDLAQELRIHLFTKLHRYNAYTSVFRNWANQVMKNKLIDMHRKTLYKNRDVLDDIETFFCQPH